MITHLLSAKIAWSLAGFLLLTSIGFNIYQHQRNNELFAKSAPGKIVENEPVSDPNNISGSVPVKTVQKNIMSVSREEKSGPVDINELEDHLNSTEEELDRTSEELSEEFTKKDNFKKAYKQYQKNLASDPDFQKTIRDSIIKSTLKNYDPLFKKLDISKEEFEEFKGILADRMEEIQNIVLLDPLNASDDEKAEMNQERMEINNKYKDIVNDFLGEENSKTYVSYVMRMSERSNLSYFMDAIPADKRISEEQTEALIDTMYAGRKAVYDEMGYDEIDISSPDDLTEENVAHEIERSKKIYDKYVEAVQGVLPAEQAEQYKAHLNRNLAMTESMLKRRMFMVKDK